MSNIMETSNTKPTRTNTSILSKKWKTPEQKMKARKRLEENHVTRAQLQASKASSSSMVNADMIQKQIDMLSKGRNH
jgi:hypothetical protein